MSISKSLAAFLIQVLLILPVCADQNIAVSFSPEKGVAAKAHVNGQEVSLTVEGEASKITEKINIETEKALKLVVDDYNFDGHPDFSVSHLDDGMGTMLIYQIYVYSSKTKKIRSHAPQVRRRIY
jgi:hypothetical protein